MERDLKNYSYINHKFKISTHTLTWSVTTVSFVIPFGLPISTHTLTWSVTGSIMAVFPYKIFQLTRSRGA